MYTSLRFTLTLVILTLSYPLQIHSVPVTVQDTGVAPGMLVSISVTGGSYSGGQTALSGSARAGVVNLLVNGKEMDGFCIDPFHLSTKTPTLYNIVDLADAPKSGSTYIGPMGEVAAQNIRKLWNLAYEPNMSAMSAAALQLAIWEVVGGEFFAWTGTGAVYDLAQSLLNQMPLQTGDSDLEALMSVTQVGQDYLIQMPDGGETLVLLGLAVATLAYIQRKVSA